MEKVLESLEEVRVKNVDGRYFIPETALLHALSESAVKCSLESLGVAVYEIGDLLNDILRGARKCFAILLLLGHGKSISCFFKRDSMRLSYPDDRLPYTFETLQHIFDGEANNRAIKQFFEKQWEFAIPIIGQRIISRNLDTEVVFPFLHEEFAGRGSMGTAWKIKLHPQCHQLSLENHEVIRKEIELRPGDDLATFQIELKNLSLLTILKHPNIIPLYCSYICRRRCNLIFAVANGGTLADFLDGKQGAGGPEGLQLLLALAELASAIDAMHNFTSKSLDLRLSGCHHDLAPRNILIRGQTFVLADFGLSTFRNAEENSLTAFKEVRGSYIAPECQIVRETRLETERIGRSSDIWSFGCIIAEILTYMVLGSDGVRKFRERRTFEPIPGIEWTRFHRGSNTPSPEVTQWLDQLESNGEQYRIRMVRLIRKMLLMNPNERPRSAQVLKVLQGISILSIAGSVSLGLDSVRRVHQTIDLILGNMHFQSWLFAFNLSLDRIERNELTSTDFDWSETVQALRETNSILEASGEGPYLDLRQSALRYQHARLIKALPLSSRSAAKEHFVKQVLQSDVDQLGALSAAINQEDEEDIGVLVALKHLTDLAEAGRLTGNNELVFDQSSITVKDDIDIHNLALLEPTSEPVLVEWLRYKLAWADKDTGPQLRERLASVVSLLHAESTAQVPGSLHCKGFFHYPLERAFGVVYSIPPLATKPVTLHGILSADKNPYRPPLEYRFQLAFDICQCIYTFHKIGWLHRNLHSMNIIFFPPEGIDNEERAKEPRIIGFAGGRENRLDAFTHGPSDDSQLRSYQHPEYLTGRERYREDFDYYSVGIVLLEIGLWTTLAKIAKSDRFKGISDDQFRKELLETRIPPLRIAMGTQYMEATRICLDGSLKRSSGASDDHPDSYYTLFKSLVMDKITLMD